MARQFGLRTEIIVNLCILMGAALLFSGFLLLRMAEREIVGERINSFTTVLDSGIVALTAAPASADRGQILAAVKTFVESLRNRFHIDHWFLVDQRFALVDFSECETLILQVDGDLFERARKHKISIIEKVKTGENRGQPGAIRMTVPLFSPDGFIGAVQVQAGFNGATARLAEFRQVLLVYMIVTGAILVLFGFFLLGRNVITPIRSLAEASKKVAAGDLTTTVATAGPAEIAALASAFNVMTSSLQASREQTLAHIRALEKSNNDLKEARAELIRSEKLASVGRLSAGMAHEIGNPLAALLGYLEYLQKEPGVPSEIIERSLYEGNRIDRLVRDLLDYAAPERTAPEVVDPVSTFAEARHVLENQGAFAGIEVIADLPASLPPILINRHKLLQVFINLLLNARDASPRSIFLGAGADEDSVWLSVKDDGMGMDEGTAAKIFDPFYSTKEPGKGRGLGLTVCHSIVDEAGGTITVNSQPGQGASFLVCFPRQGQ